MTSIQREFYDEEYVFDASQGLNFAIGFTAYDEETEDILDPSYGKVMFMKFEWGKRENDELYVEQKEIPSHVCTEEELGIKGDNSLFFPITESQMFLVKRYRKKLRCIDQEDMRVYGDFDSAYATLMIMRLVRCDGTMEVECKSED